MYFIFHKHPIDILNNISSLPTSLKLKFHQF